MSQTVVIQPAQKRSPLPYADRPYYVAAAVLTYFVFFVVQITLPYDFYVLWLDTDERRQVWRIYTYSLIHANWVHLTNNAVLCMAAGVLLNASHGNARVAVLHTTGAVGGALAVGIQHRFTGSDAIRVIGASGSIYCLIGVHAGNMAINWQELPFRWVHLTVLTAWLLMDALLYALFYDARVSYACHLGGLVTGVLMSPVVLRNARVHRWEMAYKISSAVACGIFLLGMSLNYWI